MVASWVPTPSRSKIALKNGTIQILTLLLQEVTPTESASLSSLTTPSERARVDITSTFVLVS